MFESAGSRRLLDAGINEIVFEKYLFNSYIYNVAQINLVNSSQVINMNDHQKERFTKKIVQTMYYSVSEKTVTILGFSFKKNTGDTRESAAVDICKGLLDEGAYLRIYDPMVKLQ